MTPNGHATTQYPQPLQTSDCTTTVSNSVRRMAPVGHASRHPARAQCLHTSDENSHENLSSTCCSTNATCRQVDAPSAPVLSYDMPVKLKPSPGSWFHCLHATSHALQPMQTVVSVKNPLLIDRPSCWSFLHERRFDDLRLRALLPDLRQVAQVVLGAERRRHQRPAGHHAPPRAAAARHDHRGQHLG